jgi:HEPN domain-containing protein
LIKLPTFEDAYQYVKIAKEYLPVTSRDLAKALFSIQQAIEFGVKSLLDELGIEYKTVHRLRKEYFEEAFRKLKPKFEAGEVIDWNTNRVKETLVKASAWANILESIRSYAEGYIPMKIPAIDVFDNTFYEFAKNAVNSVECLIFDLEKLANE